MPDEIGARVVKVLVRVADIVRAADEASLPVVGGTDGEPLLRPAEVGAFDARGVRRLVAGIVGMDDDVGLRVRHAGEPPRGIVGVARGAAAVVGLAEKLAVGRVGEGRRGLTVADGQFGEDVEEGRTEAREPVHAVVFVARLGEAAIARAARPVVGFAEMPLEDQVVILIKAGNDDVAQRIHDLHLAAKPVVGEGRLLDGEGVDLADAFAAAGGVVIVAVNGCQPGAWRGQHLEEHIPLVVAAGDNGVRVVAVHGLGGSLEHEVAVRVVTVTRAGFQSFVGDLNALERQLVQRVVGEFRRPHGVGGVQSAGVIAVLRVELQEVVIRIVGEEGHGSHQGAEGGLRRLPGRRLIQRIVGPERIEAARIDAANQVAACVVFKGVGLMKAGGETISDPMTEVAVLRAAGVMDVFITPPPPFAIGETNVRRALAEGVVFMILRADGSGMADFQQVAPGIVGADGGAAARFGHGGREAQRHRRAVQFLMHEGELRAGQVIQPRTQIGAEA